MKWLSTSIGLLIWAGGMLLLRRRTSRKDKIAFTVGMFAIAALQFVNENVISFIVPEITPLFSILFCMIWVVVVGFRFHRWGQTRAFVPLALAVCIMILPLPWWGSISHVTRFAMFAAVGLLIVISMFLMFLNKHQSRSRKPTP